MTTSYSIPCSSSAFCTFQHGCALQLHPDVRAAIELDRHRPTILRCARSSSTSRGSPRSRTCPSRKATASSSACSPAGSAAPTSRRSAPRPPAPCSGHEVVAEADGRRVALVHHLPCGECERCLAGHESTCEAFRRGDDRPGRLRRAGARRPRRCRPAGRDRRRDRDLRRAARLRAARGRAAAARAACSWSGTASSGGCSAPFSGTAATRSSRSTPTRGATAGTRTAPSTPPSSAPRAAATEAAEALGSGRHAARLRPLRPARARRRLPPRADRARLAVGDAAAHARGVSLLPELDLPEPTVLPLERFHEGLDLYRRGEALKVVFTP